MNKICTMILFGLFLVLKSSTFNDGKASLRMSARQIDVSDLARDLALRAKAARESGFGYHEPKKSVEPPQIFSDCDNPCVMRNVRLIRSGFSATIDDMLQNHVRPLFVIDGWCLNNCAYFADAHRQYVCVTKNVMLGYSNNPDHVKVTSPILAKWLKKQKIPKNGFITFGIATAKTLWFECELNPPLPRPDPRKGITATAE